MLPELRPRDAGGLIYRLAGIAVARRPRPVDGHVARVDKTGAWSVDVDAAPRAATASPR